MESISQAAGKTKNGDRIASAGPPLTTIEEEDEDADADAVAEKVQVVKGNT